MHIATRTDGGGMLRYLVTFWKIGVEIVFTREIVITGNFRIAGYTHPDRIFHRSFVKSRQSARMSERNWAYMCIGLAAERSIITTEELGLRQKLRMHLKTHHYFIFISLLRHRRKNTGFGRKWSRESGVGSRESGVGSRESGV